MIERLLRGAGAGLGATAVMTAMLWAERSAGVLGSPPPKRITGNVARKVGIKPHKMPKEAFHLSWFAAHVGYGVAAGVTYMLVRRILPSQKLLAGPIFGLAVWFISYVGVLPALDLYPAPNKERKSQVEAMIVAHLVYGASLAALSE